MRQRRTKMWRERLPAARELRALRRIGRRQPISNNRLLRLLRAREPLRNFAVLRSKLDGCGVAGVFGGQARRRVGARWDVFKLFRLEQSPESEIVEVNLAHNAPRCFDRGFSARRHTRDLHLHLVLKLLVPRPEQLDALAVDLATADVRVKQRFHSNDAIARDAPALYERGQLVQIQRR